MPATIMVTAYSTTGKARNGKSDTTFGVSTEFGNARKSWIVPLRDATMNQAALLAVKFGILAVRKDDRPNLSIRTDNLYLITVLGVKDDKWAFKPSSNKELVKEIRNMLSWEGRLNYFSIEADKNGEEVKKLGIDVRVVAKKRLAKAS